MAKKSKSFVCYGSIGAGGISQILYRTALTPGNDPISKNLATAQSAAQFTTYLSDLTEASTIFGVAVVDAGVRTQLTTMITSHVAARQVDKRNTLKVALFVHTEGADAGFPAFLITQTINGSKSTTVITLGSA